MAVLDTTSIIGLAEPDKIGSVTLEHCLASRRSVREFSERSLSERELGQLLWAVQGVTSLDNRRSVPSAGAVYPLEIIAVCGKSDGLRAGVYRYHPLCHGVSFVAGGHQREKLAQAARGQDWIAAAPVVICISAVFERTTAKYGNRGRGYVYIEAGHAAQSLMLQALALGLATTIVGAFDDDEVRRLLHLTSVETPLSLLPVGHPR